MKSSELISGKKYLIMEKHIGEFVANDGRDIYFKIENDHPFVPQPEDGVYPGTVGLLNVNGYIFEEVK